MSTNILYYIAGAIIVFALVRQIILWYWKINLIVELLEKIERNTKPNHNLAETKSQPPAQKVEITKE